MLQLEGLQRLRNWSNALPQTVEDLRPSLITALQLEVQRQQDLIPVKTGKLRQSLVNPFDPYHKIFELPAGAGVWSSLPYADKYRDRVPRPDPRNLAQWLHEELERRLHG